MASIVRRPGPSSQAFGGAALHAELVALRVGEHGPGGADARPAVTGP
ncbi:hypothetical protein ABZS66_56265 [Dactylosporangium sp. NPDC005572]